MMDQAELRAKAEALAPQILELFQSGALAQLAQAPAPAKTPAPKPVTKTKTVHKKFMDLRTWLNDQVFEREAMIDGLLIGAITGYPVAGIGLPGTAKSLLAELLSQAFDLPYFYACLAPDSPPEIIFGPLDLKALEQGRYERASDGTLATAVFVTIDEIFKANSAILQHLLPVINERRWKNGKTVHDLPLRLFVGLSNEVPLAEERSDLMALWDRFVLRYWVEYIDDSHFDTYLTDRYARLKGKVKAQAAPRMTLADLDAALDEAQDVDLGPVLPTLITLRPKLRAAGYELSDRKWDRLLLVLMTHVWLQGRTKARVSDLVILKHMLWTRPEEVEASHKLVDSLVADRYKTMAQDFAKRADGVHHAFRQNPTGTGVSSAAALKKLAQEIGEAIDQAKEEGEDTHLLETAQNTCVRHYDAIIAHARGQSTQGGNRS